MKIKLLEKDSIIDILRAELKQKEKLHAFDKYSNEKEIEKLMREIDLLQNRNIHHNKIPSYSSLSTCNDESEIKFDEEKIKLEKELIDYKCKYAETKASLSEIEGEFRRLFRQINVIINYLGFKIKL